MATGTAELDFGAFPGASDASVAVTGQAGIVAGSRVEAWIEPRATADHTADEHMLETLRVFADASSIIAGTGFTIRGFNTNPLNEPLEPRGAGRPALATTTPSEPALAHAGAGGRGTRLWGRWHIAWAWA